MATGREIPKAEPDSDGAVAWAVGAIPDRETEMGGVPVGVTIEGRPNVSVTAGTAKLPLRPQVLT